jgi:hypothetical protein
MVFQSTLSKKDLEKAARELNEGFGCDFSKLNELT